MGDMAEVFREMTRLRKEKRQSNTENGIRTLRSKGIKFESKNGGVHIVIDEYNTGPIDYWPSTGLWIPRSTGIRKRGIFPLLEYIGKTNR